MAALITGSTRSRTTWLVDFAQFLETGAIDKQVVSVGADGQPSPSSSTAGCSSTPPKSARGRVVTASATEPGEAHWRDIVPERSDAIIEDVA
jgi:hypothetical protein